MYGGSYLKTLSELKHFDEDDFKASVLEARRPVLVDFYADWCGPCKMMAPVVEQIATEYDGRVSVGKLDVDSAAEIAIRYRIMGVPTLGYFRNGELVDRLVGYPGPNGVRAFVEKNATTTVS